MFCYSSASLHSWLWEAALSPNTGNTLCLVNTRCHKKVEVVEIKMSSTGSFLNYFKMEQVVLAAGAPFRLFQIGASGVGSSGKQQVGRGSRSTTQNFQFEMI